MIKLFNFFKVNPAFLLIILAIPVGLPTLRSDFFSIHDETHMVDLYQMYRSLQLGGFPPRWAPDVNFGLGHPYFNFYYHLPFYITSLLMFLGLSMISAFKAYLLITVISAILGFYFFARRHFSKGASFMAATLYLYTPYFAVDLYVRGAVGELAIFALLPWVAFSLNHLITTPTIFKLLATALLISLLVIAHNVLHIFIFPLLFSYALILTLSEKKFFKKYIFVILSFVFGLGLSSYYWLPALWEKQFISNYEQIKIEDHFPFIKQLVIPYWGYGTSHWGPNDDISFQIGIVNLISILLSFVLLIKAKTRKNLATFFMAIFFIAILLMNIRTLPFWNLHPILRHFQFPWRLLMLTTFSTAWLLGFSANYIFKKLDQKRILFYSTLVILIVLSLNIWYFKPSEFKKISDERYLELYFANKTFQEDGERGHLSKEYLNFSEDFIPPTKWQLKRPNDLPPSMVEAEKEAKISYKKEGFNYLIEADSPQDNTLIVYTTYFPGWTAYIDDKRGIVYPATNLGVLSIPISFGKQTIKLVFEDSLVRKIGNTISLAFALLLFLLLLKTLINFKRN